MVVVAASRGWTLERRALECTNTTHATHAPRALRDRRTPGRGCARRVCGQAHRGRAASATGDAGRRQLGDAARVHPAALTTGNGTQALGQRRRPLLPLRAYEKASVFFLHVGAGQRSGLTSSR